MFHGSEDRNPVEDFNSINEELKKYSEKLSKRKQIILANKIDVMQDETLYKELEKVAKKNNIEIFKISAATNTGLKEVFNRVAEVLKTLPKEDLIEYDEKVVYTLKENKDEFNVEIKNGEYLVTGNAIERLLGRVNMEDNESMYYFQKSLRELGIEEKLKQMGVQEGDIVKFVNWEFEWYE